MLEAVDLARLDAYRAQFPGPHLALVLGSVAAGNTPARLWVEQAGTALLWDQGNNVLYLAGAPTEGARRELAALIGGPLRAAALARRRPFFKARALDPALDAALPELFAGVALRALDTRFYADPAPEGPPPATPDLDGVRFAPITQALLEQDGLANRAAVRHEIGLMWPDPERFFAHGLGYAALVGQEIVCWCTAEYVGPERCGVGIETAEAHQRRGIAGATAARLLQAVRRRGLTTCWECRADNTPSRRLAEKLGLALVAEERYYAGMFA